MARLSEFAAYPKIVVDQRDQPHVLYYKGFIGRRQLRYARRAPGGDVGRWKSEAIVNVRDDTVGGLAVDGAGRLHVAFYETPPQTLRYATRGGGSADGGGGKRGKCQGEQCILDPERTTAAQVPEQPDEIEAICTRLAAGVKDKCEVQGFEATPQSAGFPQARRGSPRRLTKKVRQRFDPNATATPRFRLRLNPIGRQLLQTATVERPLDVEVRFKVKSAKRSSLLVKLVRMVRGSM